MSPDFAKLSSNIKDWGQALGFQAVGIADVELADDEAKLNEWLAAGYHGDMAYMSKHGSKRSRPAELIPGTIRVITARMDYWPANTADPEALLHRSERGYVSRYALGRDYHKVIRKRLKKLADQIAEEIGDFGYRVFTDSAPVLEKALARKAGLGWVGKHSNLLTRERGSWFFLGEIYTDLPLSLDEPISDHCGTCTTCMDVCPTDAIVAPYQVDARRCVSYLTIEHHGPIPIELRSQMGNRIYGCDDCQLFCPWNKYAVPTTEQDFAARHELDDPSLVELFGWSQSDFLSRTEGSPIRRIGYQRWLRNIAVALGNATTSAPIVSALISRTHDADPLVREHVQWALAQHDA